MQFYSCFTDKYVDTISGGIDNGGVNLVVDNKF